MNRINDTELYSLEETRSEFNRGREAIKLGIDVHQHFYTIRRAGLARKCQRMRSSSFGEEATAAVEDAGAACIPRL